jgi:hypothetical protein
MSNTNQTVPTSKSVDEFLAKLETEEQVADSHILIQMMNEITGEPPVMWGPSIIGFGSEHYKYESGREGDMPKLGFSPRKGKLSFYITYSPEKYTKQLEAVGKYKHSKACIYLKDLSSIDIDALRKLIQACYDDNEAAKK